LIEHIKPLISISKYGLTSIESAILLRENFFDFYTTIAGDKETNIFKTVLHREDNTYTNYDGFNDIVKMYLDLEVSKYINMSLKEFMSLTSYTYNTVITAISKVKQDELEILQEIENTNGYPNEQEN